MKTLAVSCCPRGPQSYSKQVLEAFLEGVPPGTVEHLDLLNDRPEFWEPASLEAYFQRNWARQGITASQQAAIAPMDRMTAQLKSAGVLVIACPMWNFSVPAAVKAWFDAVILKGETWDIGPDGKYLGLMQGRKALFILASGGVYDDGPMAGYEHAASLASTLLGFMGFDEVRSVVAAGTNLEGMDAAAVVANAKDEARQIAREWYG
jgi:FMN-dependent NADH-azoreductase